MPKVHYAHIRPACDPYQVKEHKKLVSRLLSKVATSFGFIGKSCHMYLKKEKKCSKFIKNVKFEDVMRLIPQIWLQIWIFHEILVQGTMSKAFIFCFVAIYDANQRINKKGKKMAYSVKNLVICSGLLAHMLLI